MKKSIYCLLGSLIVMIVLPFLTVKFAGMNGMAICFILFYGVNPFYSLICGIYAGKKWYIPLVNALLFLAGVWIFFTIEEIAFVYYSIGYFIIGIIAMLIKNKFYRG